MLARCSRSAVAKRRLRTLAKHAAPTHFWFGPLSRKAHGEHFISHAP